MHHKKHGIVCLLVALAFFVSCGGNQNPSQREDEVTTRATPIIDPDGARRELEAKGLSYDQDTFLRLLDASVTKNNIESAAAYLKAGMNPNAHDPWGGTALMRVAGTGNEPILGMLLDRKANVNAQDDEGNTALHFAVRSELSSVAIRLVNSGADINGANHCGETPLDVAEFWSRLRTATALEQAGGKHGRGATRSTDANAGLSLALISTLMARKDVCETQRALGALRRIGSAEDKYEVGRRYHDGSANFPKDPAKAVAWLELASASGDPRAGELIEKLRTAR